MTKNFDGGIFGRSVPLRCKIFTPIIKTAKVIASAKRKLHHTKSGRHVYAPAKKIISRANERRNASKFENFTCPTVKRAVKIIALIAAGISDSE